MLGQARPQQAVGRATENATVHCAARGGTGKLPLLLNSFGFAERNSTGRKAVVQAGKH